MHIIFLLLSVAFTVVFAGCASTHAPQPVNGNNGDDHSAGDFILVPSGEFRMGSRPQTEGYQEDEFPQHTVYLDAYYIGAYEVTNTEYAAFLTDSAGGSRFWSEEMEIMRSGVRFIPRHGFEEYPVRFVSWTAAKTYAEWIGGRLPTEAEWEKAARGHEDTRLFPWGDQISTGLANYYNFNGEPWPVGQATGRSYYGCYDMAGNLWEWTADWYEFHYYRGLPTPADNPTGPQIGEYKVIRGGSYLEMEYIRLRCAERNGIQPELRFEDLGFRCVSDSTDYVEQGE